MPKVRGHISAEKNVVGGRRIMTKKVEYIGEKKRETWAAKKDFGYFLVAREQVWPSVESLSSAPDGIK